MRLLTGTGERSAGEGEEVSREKRRLLQDGDSRLGELSQPGVPRWEELRGTHREGEEGVCVCVCVCLCVCVCVCVCVIRS